MKKIAITSAFYYIENSGFSYKYVPRFLEWANKKDESIDFCSKELLKEILENINTRLIDRQSLSLEAAAKIAESEGFFDDLNKEELSIVAGSYSSAAYPNATFNLSTKGNSPNFVNATEFTNTVGNAAVSRLCIWNQFRGEAYAISEGLNSGLNAVIDAYNNIIYKNTKDVLACATEEFGSAIVLITNEKSESFKHKPIAYIKNCDSRYLGEINNLINYFDLLEDIFNLRLKDIDIYLSGDFDLVNYIILALKAKKFKVNELINKNIWSLAPLVDIGRCLCSYENGSTKDSLVVCLDSKGFVSSLQLTKR